MGLEVILPPFILLLAGLITFRAASLKVALWARGLIWLLGVLLLFFAYWLIADHGNHYGLLALIGDALGKPSQMSQSVLGVALFGNWRSVAGNLAPMFDILLALTIPLALVTLLTFIPSAWTPKVTRPPLLFLLGAIGGGFIALVLVAAGLGGYTKDRVYAGILRDSDVIDGDTIRMGDVTLRLWGIDAPDYNASTATRPSARNQFCYSAVGMAYGCGAASRAALAQLVTRKLVSCGPPPAHDLNEVQRVDSSGRPVVRCLVRQAKGPDLDIAQAMVASGNADVFTHDGRREGYYATYVGIARQNRLGMWASLTKPPLSPDQWRNNDSVRQSYIEQLPLPQEP